MPSCWPIQRSIPRMRWSTGGCSISRTWCSANGPTPSPSRWRVPAEAFKSDYDIGLFRDVAATRGVNVFGRAGGAVLEDFDNDGHLDLMTSHMGIEEQVNFFRNRGDGHFAR